MWQLLKIKYSEVLYKVFQNVYSIFSRHIYSWDERKLKAQLHRIVLCGIWLKNKPQPKVIITINYNAKWFQNSIIAGVELYYTLSTCVLIGVSNVRVDGHLVVVSPNSKVMRGG